MFRSAKPKKNKRRRVADDEDEQSPGAPHTSEDVPVMVAAADRRSLNTFSVGHRVTRPRPSDLTSHPFNSL
jgi:hypothetical protein